MGGWGTQSIVAGAPDLKECLHDVSGCVDEVIAGDWGVCI